VRRNIAADVARHELIGLEVSVKDVSGRVVDETKHTFLVETPKGVKRVGKAGNRFVFRLGSDAVALDGDDIMFQPEDRTKKVRG
jgi:ribonuclease P protein subunit POP4